MKTTIRPHRIPTIRLAGAVSIIAVAAALTAVAQDPEGPKPPEADFPPTTETLKDYQKVVSTADEPSFYTLYKREKDQQLMAELPKDFARQRHYIALTVASGESYAGLQAGDLYVYWRRYGNKLALIEPNLGIRSTGDDESKASVKRLFTDRVILEVPILGIVPKGGPLIDMDALLVGQAEKFFGGSARNLMKGLTSIKTAKSFPSNVEVGFEVPAQNGQLRILHYSISHIPEDKSYKPRVADTRVGYFTTSYNDFGKFKEDETRVRYINRWQLEKADTSLKLSPPKDPIVFYIEHTTPIRYRRWVRDGILMWNKAFEKVGIFDALEVRQQDARSGAHMEKDPEDVRYNFVRWLNNGVGTAIGPSRVHPETGQILDADIILTDGWIRHWWMEYNEIMPDVALEGYAPNTLAWLYRHPSWDPRVRLADPSTREIILAQRASQAMPALGGHPLGKLDEAADSRLIGGHEFDGLTARYSQKNGLCMAANCKSHGIGLMQMALAIQDFGAALASDLPPEPVPDPVPDEATEDDPEGKEEDKEEAKKEDEKPAVPAVPAEARQMVDGIPEEFIGPLLADLVAHEVGHTLGLRHNFKASSVYTMAEINSDEHKGKAALAGSVMDYIPVNMNVGAGEIQGDYAMIGVGPYDLWAIEYGYTLEDDLKPILDRVAEPELAYATDEDTWGPDPLARRYDFGKEPISYGENQLRLIEKLRASIIESFVKDGDSWAKARRGYQLTLSTQMRVVTMMANWVGGAHVYRDKKGDKDGRAPIEVVPAATQRAALEFVVANALNDDAFGLTPQLLAHMTVDKWWDDGNIMDDPTWPIHDRILGIQASILTALMNPNTLELVFDNEFRVPADEDALTLPELLETLQAAVFGAFDAEIHADAPAFTARKPMLSSLQRNLQKEYLERLIDLIGPDAGFTAAYKPITDLASSQLGEIKEEIESLVENEKLDPYTRSHLKQCGSQIDKALDAQYVIDAGKGSRLPQFILMGKEPADSE
ncbi:zinc-dependent metalloprotease [soil metagenome]